MNPQEIELYGNTTFSDLLFMEPTSSFPSTTSADIMSATMSDAESAPPELNELFSAIEKKCEELVLLSNRQVPPEWNMADLIRTVMGNDALQIPGHLQDTYYDVFLRGATSWLFEDLGNFFDLINYAL